MPSRTTTWVLGPCLGLAIATFIAFAGGPAAAGDKIGNGFACRVDADCESGNCNAKKCKGKSGHDKLSNGAECRATSDCESGDCRYGKCHAKGSADKLANGAACTYDSECESKHCTFKKCKAK